MFGKFGFDFGGEAFEFAAAHFGDPVFVAWGNGEGVERLGEGKVEVEADHFAVLLDLGAGVDDFLADFLAGNGGGVVEHFAEAAKLLDELRSGLRADAGDAGDVVHAVADEGQYVADLLGCDAPFPLDGFGAEEGVRVGGLGEVGFVGGVDVDLRADELEKVFVVGGQEYVVTPLTRGDGVAGHEVVGFVAGESEAGEAHHGHQFADGSELGNHVAGHLGALGFVVGLEGGAAFGEAFVPDDGGQIRLEVFEHFPDGFNEAVDGVGRSAGGVSQAANGEKRAVNVVVPVDDEEFFSHRSSSAMGPA